MMIPILKACSRVVDDRDADSGSQVAEALSQTATKPKRTGLASSELAVCLPVIILMVFGMIESCTMIFLQQSLTISAYEGARRSIGQDGSNASVIAASEQILLDRSIVGYQIHLSHADISRVDPGTYITITVSASCDDNSCMNGWFYANQQLQSQVVMMKEF
jgi:hypothetical protein